PAEATLTKPVALARTTPGLLAAVNANAFAHLPTATAAERKRGWFAGKAVDIHGLAAADGKIRSPSAGERTDFWFDAAGRPHLGEVPPETKIRHGVADWGQLLVKDGRILAGPDGALHPRTLAGFDAGRRWWWLVVIDGRRRGVSEGMTLAECAELMAARGCAYAINLDGGGSSILLQQVPAKPGPTTINRPSDGTPRAIPVMLGVRRKER
ncbi:MAG: phosphodiester glycosidase family protein, partial [Akkermansiaceae bacterium]|nr:phosphodiester glycosidase family protein [Akkermansiaceae bacterium]